MRKLVLIMLCLVMLVTGCNGKQDEPAETAEKQETVTEDEVKGDVVMKMKIDDRTVDVVWEDNDSVKALEKMCESGEVVVSMSMYGGFEQVGSLETGITRNDHQTVTSPGDIVLYSGDSIVVFYGSNSWSYTRLGHISGMSESELRDLLGNGDVTLTLYRE